jgi:hypothetical protein
VEWEEVWEVWVSNRPDFNSNNNDHLVYPLYLPGNNSNNRVGGIHSSTLNLPAFDLRSLDRAELEEQEGWE